MQQNMTIEFRSLDQITPYPGNPRDNDDAVDAVAASLKEFGFRQPIVVDAAGVIIVGHTRFKAAKKLGLAKVPVLVVHDDPLPRDEQSHTLFVVLDAERKQGWNVGIGYGLTNAADRWTLKTIISF